MTTNKAINDTINVPDAPQIEGLRFRHFRGEADYPAMVKIVTDSNATDKLERCDTVEDIARAYRHLVNSDPARDMIFAEINGEAIGYARLSWHQIEDGPRVYSEFVHLTPAWRGKGIRRALMHFCEGRGREIARNHDIDAPKAMGAWANDSESDWVRLLDEEGFKAIRFEFEMVRENLEDIPNLPLPEGLETREVQPEHYQEIIDAAKEAFRDHWGFSEEEWSDAEIKSWMESDEWQPHLWQVAWDGDEVAGMILNFIDEKQNRQFDRKRGYTETICVRRPWRRRGLARALIARSLHVHKEQGMTETALGVDTENPSGALRLYRSMGYKMTKRYANYRKPLNAEPPAIGEEPI